MLFQSLLVLLLVAVVYIAGVNIVQNLAAVGIHIDYGFLGRQAGFDVNESLIDYDAGRSYGRALWVGVLNTLALSAVCIVGATVLGTVMGMLRTSQNWLGSTLAYVYVEVMRNLPKLLILLTLYILTINQLPPVRQAVDILGVFHLSNRAFYFPALIWQPHMHSVLIALLVTVLLLFVYRRFVIHHQQKTGQRWPIFWPGLALLCLVWWLSSLLFNVHYVFEIPRLQGFDFSGGGRISVQFLVLALALSVYHGGQVAELVRGGIQSVSKGQEEAARSSGLTYLQVMRLVVLPQALRVIIPSMGNQYLNITKNTSIGLAVGFSDLVSVMNTAINQTFRPIELMSIAALIYLSICLVVTLLINLYNRRMRLEKA
ncbi:amino acid ABC transporter permease [Saccharospirillum mangrovi]|uniref:amino acid ABC transporter permease n=1 Tax=Saccharospirillum mangrovi TaxID=2161747 RepID=UPI0013001B39|nr:ABC transporter permease subunit [Saccharospirillum mangrovi]